MITRVGIPRQYELVATALVKFSKWKRDDFGGWRGILFDRLCPEQRADLRDIGLGTGAGQQAIVESAVEAVREEVDQEAVNKVLSEVWGLH